MMAAPKILVIGGGPAGLGAAIEARLSGADVAVVEKRDVYTRQNTLFLYTSTLELLERWGVHVPLMQELYFQGERRGYVLIKDLENALSQKLADLGVVQMRGECHRVQGQQAWIQTSEGELRIPYDLLVAADGAHSHLREQLGIPSIHYGEALAGVVMIPAVHKEGLISVQILNHPQVYIKKVMIPSATVFFFQTRPDAAGGPIGLHECVQFAEDMGLEEAELMKSHCLFCLDNVPIDVQKMERFADPMQNMIFLGDAAATSSFYLGTGANYAFKMTQVAKTLFQHFSQEGAFAQFDEEMRPVCEELVQLSVPLFCNHRK
ncbi:MAG: FAD-dependent monooxygenase [Verrucomicrobia bacterium]|nr:FAD-dependent monooxygenase [Verrucomicrobiota bacterium]